MLRQPSPVTTNANGKVLLCATLLAALGAGGCNDESDTGNSTEELQEVQSAKDSDAPFVASIKANGTGCPARTWTAKLAEDGQSFRILFTGFETEVDRRRSVHVKDCQLTISVTSPADQQYSVQSFGYAGYAYLREGANAKISSVHYFQGDPSRQHESKAELIGPQDEGYALTTEIPSSEAIWSECGKTRDLNVRTTVRLQGTGGRTSTFTLAEIEGIKLAVRKCGEKPDGGPAPDKDGGPDGGPSTPDADGGPDGGPTTPDTDGGPTTPDTGKGPSIEAVTALGTGCPANSSTITLAGDKKSFHIAFNEWEATSSPSQTSQIKDCTLGIKPAFKAGEQVALKSWSFKSNRSVAQGASIRFLSVPSIQGSPVTGTPVDENGPLSGPYTYRVEVPDAELAWTPCNAARDINLRTTLRQANGTATSASSVKILETDGFVLVSRTCTP